MKVNQFIDDMKKKKIQATAINPNAVSDYIRKTLEIKEYIPFEDKKKIAEMIIKTNMTEENGIKKINSAGQFVSFITAMLVIHTNLEIDAENPIEDYDLICEAGLLEPIVAEFQKDYSECEVILKMTAADELADNNLSSVVAKFLGGISDMIGGFGNKLGGIVENIDIGSLLGGKFDTNDLAKLKGFLDKYNN